MKTLLAIIAFAGSFQMIFAQGDTLLPLGQNTDILKPVKMKAGPETFDSTFIYTSDTLEITTTKSLLDDFSKDHFQKYVPDFTDPDITFDKTYKLLDATTSLPLPVNVKFSNLPTTRKIVNVAAGTVVTEALPSTQIKLGDFGSYPPVYSTTTVYPPYNLIDTVDLIGDDTDTIPNVSIVQDSATQFFAQIHDQNAYWLDSYAYHNYRFARNPWTLGVVTFDGLNQYGYPYMMGSTASGQADVLHSKPIDMSSLNAAQEVYMSFLYQTEGFGDVPEATDSLVLEFYAPAVDQWFRVWSTKGAPVSDFKKAHIRIQDVKYFQNGFQFRFLNYGGLSGSLDHFHIDYVHLRALSGAQDTLFKDFAFVYPLGSFLKDYTSVPWEHYQNNFAGKMTDAAKIVVRNGSNITENSQNGQATIEYEGNLEGSFTLSAVTLTGSGLANYAPRTTVESYHDFSSGYHFDETKPGDSQVFDLMATATSPFAQITVNDSAFGQQIFRNYYAYDDGSAEQAYGTTGNQSRLAYQFTPYEADSLIGVQMHFVPTVNDVSNNLFLLTVWGDGGGKPGAVIYEDNFFFPRQPKYEVGRNEFTTYYLKDTMKLPISGTFYIGWRQLESEVLGIGFDRNTINSDKIFYSVDLGNTWINTTKQGSLLMRPIFSTALDATLGIPEQKQPETFFDVYPNPASDVIHFRIDPAVYAGAMVFDLQGKMILQVASDSHEADLSQLKSGVYVIREVNSGITRKIIKN